MLIHPQIAACKVFKPSPWLLLHPPKKEKGGDVDCPMADPSTNPQAVPPANLVWFTPDMVARDFDGLCINKDQTGKPPLPQLRIPVEFV